MLIVDGHELSSVDKHLLVEGAVDAEHLTGALAHSEILGVVRVVLHLTEVHCVADIHEIEVHQRFNLKVYVFAAVDDVHSVNT